MVGVDNAIIARLKTHGQNFEILVDCNNAIALKGGKDVNMRDVLAAMKIFSDSKKGLEASETSMKQIFETADVEEVAKKIIQKGEIQLTSEYRDKLKEEKKKQVIDMIHRNAVDPTTHAPHPPQRIENALNEAKFHFDMFMPVQKQIEEALKQLKPIIPIKFEVKEIAVKFPSEFGGKAYHVVSQFGKIIKDEWLRDGSWMVVVEMPGGLEEEFYDKINKLTQGNVESKVLKIK
ncbi:ribosome assembly factor SBDS [Candidatus Woesearchaeota archaeon]|nr:ribosome assembly factor SBDS [Candidatus Woesearchaeota archaeon]